MPNNVNTKEDLSLVSLSERVEKVLFKLMFLKQATYLLIKEVDENGGGRDIGDANFGMGFYYDEMLNELDQLSANLRYIHSQNEKQKPTRKPRRQAAKRSEKVIQGAA